MFISTLGKDPSTGHVFDDVYGELIQDILDDETATDKGNSEDTIMEKDEFDIGKVYVDFNLIILNEFSYLGSWIDRSGIKEDVVQNCELLCSSVVNVVDSNPGSTLFNNIRIM